MTPKSQEAIRQKLLQATDLINEAAEIFDREEKSLKGSAVELALTAYYFIDTTYDIVDTARKTFGKKVDFLKNSALVEMMEDRKVKSVNVIIEKMPKRFTVNVRQTCTMVDKEGGMAWLREQGQGGLIQETVNSSSLSAFSKQYAEEKGADLPEDYFKVGTMKYVSVTKA